VVGAVALIMTERSPYIVRTMHAQTQVTVPMAQWAAKNGIRRVVIQRSCGLFSAAE
jgi:branched-chain amino acid transport system substrate-binding protein